MGARVSRGGRGAAAGSSSAGDVEPATPPPPPQQQQQGEEGFVTPQPPSAVAARERTASLKQELVEEAASTQKASESPTTNHGDLAGGPTARQTLYQKAKLLSDVKVGTVKEFRKLMGPDWTGKRGDALLVLVEDRPTNDVRGALGTLDLSARGLQDCPRLQGYIRLQVLDLSHNIIQQVHRSVWALKNLRKLSLRRTGLLKLPEQVGRLRKLSSLDIGENSIHTLPLTLSRFVSLIVKLKLDGNPLIFPPLRICEATGDDTVDAFRVLAYLRNHSRMLAGLPGGVSVARKHGAQATQLRLLLVGEHTAADSRSEIYHALLGDRVEASRATKRRAAKKALAAAGDGADADAAYTPRKMPTLSLDQNLHEDRNTRAARENATREFIHHAETIVGGRVEMLTVHASSGMQGDGDAHTRKMELALYDMAFDVASTFVNGESTLFVLVWDAVEPTKNALDAMAIISGDRARNGEDVFTAKDFDAAKKVVQLEYNRWATVLVDRVTKPLTGLLEAYPEASVLLVMNRIGIVERPEWIKHQASQVAMICQAVVSRFKAVFEELERELGRQVGSFLGKMIAKEQEVGAPAEIDDEMAMNDEEAAAAALVPADDSSTSMADMLNKDLLELAVQKIRFNASVHAKYTKQGASHSLATLGARTLAFRGFSVRLDVESALGIDVLREKIGEVASSLHNGLAVNPGVIFRSTPTPAPQAGIMRKMKLRSRQLIGLETSVPTCCEVAKLRKDQQMSELDAMKSKWAAIEEEMDSVITVQGVLQRPLLYLDRFWYGGAILEDRARTKYKGSIHALVACSGNVVACSSTGTSTVWCPTQGGRMANNNYGWQRLTTLHQNSGNAQGEAVAVLAGCTLLLFREVKMGRASAPSERLVTIGNSGDLLVWNPDEAWKVERRTSVRSPLSVCAWDEFVAVGCEDGIVRVYDIDPPQDDDDELPSVEEPSKIKRLANLKGHESGVHSMAASVPGYCGTDPNGLDSVLFTGGSYGQVRMWLRIRSVKHYQHAMRIHNSQLEAIERDGDDANLLDCISTDPDVEEEEETVQFACIGKMDGFLHGLVASLVDSTGLACHPGSLVAADGDGRLRVVAYRGNTFHDWGLNHIMECKMNNRSFGSFGATKADSAEHSAAAQHLGTGGDSFGTQQMFEKSWHVASLLSDTKHGSITALEAAGGYLVTAGLDMSIRMWVAPRRCVSLDVENHLRLDGLPKLGRTKKHLRDSWTCVRVISMKQPAFSLVSDGTVLLAGTGGPHGGAGIQIFSSLRPVEYVPPNANVDSAFIAAAKEIEDVTARRRDVLVRAGIVEDEHATSYPFKRRHSASDLRSLGLPDLTDKMLEDARGSVADLGAGKKATFDAMHAKGKAVAVSSNAVSMLGKLQKQKSRLDEDPMKRFRSDFESFRKVARFVRFRINATRSDASHRLDLAAAGSSMEAAKGERGRQMSRITTSASERLNEQVAGQGDADKKKAEAASWRRRTASAPPAIRFDLGYHDESAHRAATRIQSTMRGKKSRREMQLRIHYHVRVQAPAREFSRAHATVVIRASFLAYLQRRKFKREREAMVRVQAGIRGFLQRRRFLRDNRRPQGYVPVHSSLLTVVSGKHLLTK